MCMISLIIAESALEMVPKEIRNHASVRNHAERAKRNPGDLLLDRSYHHAAMKGLRNAEKRGRPDLVHFALLSALATPLYLQDGLTVYLHTTDDLVITIGRRVRLPKTYARFETLLVQLLKTKVIETNGQVLLSISEMSFQELSRKIRSDITVGLSSSGSMNSVRLVAEELRATENATFVIGGFPKSDFSQEVLESINSLYSISPTALEAHLVIARIIYDLEVLRNL